MPPMRRPLVALVLALIALPLSLAAQDRPPNIVLIVADDLGYGHLGSYGQQLIETPNLDRLAAQGLRFTSAYSGSTVCAPSRSVLMTGLHTGHTPIRGNWGGMPLRDEDITVAEVLHDAGYATGIFGKWGLGEHGTSGTPNRQGFDEFFGYLHQIHAHFYYPEYLWKNETRWPLPANDVGGRIVGEAGGRTYAGDASGRRSQYAPDEIIDQALHFIRSNADRPFFAYVPTVIPHVEVVAPDTSVARYVGRFEEVPCSDPRAGYAGSDHPKAMYAAMITHMDHNVGKLLALLEELGIDGETLVLFTSDNGAQGGYCANPEFFDATGGLRGFKTEMYEGGIRVPLIARWPGRTHPGSTTDAPVYFPDYMPTFAELAGLEAPPTDGMSLVPLLKSEPASGDRFEDRLLYWEFARGRSVDGPELQQAVRSGAWKAVRHHMEEAIELYDLATDPAETINVAEAHPDVVDQMRRLMQSERSQSRPHLEPVRVRGRYFR